MACLTAFLAAAEARDFVDGQWDCCLFVADWVRACVGQDPARGWRGTYRDPRVAQAILTRDGGVAGVMAQGAARVGLTATVDPRRGDIGVITDPSSGQDLGAICTGARWAARARRGLIVIPAAALKAWRIPCRL